MLSFIYCKHIDYFRATTPTEREIEESKGNRTIMQNEIERYMFCD